MEDITIVNYKQKLLSSSGSVLQSPVLNTDEEATFTLTVPCSEVFSSFPGLIKGKSQLHGSTYWDWSRIRRAHGADPSSQEGHLVASSLPCTLPLVLRLARPPPIPSPHALLFPKADPVCLLRSSCPVPSGTVSLSVVGLFARVWSSPVWLRGSEQEPALPFTGYGKIRTQEKQQLMTDSNNTHHT